MGDLGRIDGFTGDQVAHTLSWALRYERLKLRVLPSKPDKKAPMLAYAEYWDGPMPTVRELWNRWPSGNLQIMTGPESVVVLDCDGPAGVEQFHLWCRDRNYNIPRTWISSNHATAGRHFWFTVPGPLRRFPFPPRRLLWGVWDSEAKDGRGAWKKRSAVELLGSRSLVMAPPSIHPDDTSRVYKWHRGSSPVEVRRPAPLPMWIMTIPTMERPQAPPDPFVPAVKPDRRKVAGTLELPCAPSDVIRAIGDLESFVTMRWGLRVVHKSRVGARGYKDCHDFDREDKNPSARFRPRDGRFWRPDLGKETWCLFRLGVEMGFYATWREACIDLGREYLPQVFRRD